MRRLYVEVPDDEDAEKTVRALEAMLNAGSRVVLLRRPALPEGVWNQISEVLVTRAVAALHGQPVGELGPVPIGAVRT